MLIQFLLLFFIIFALSRVLLQLKQGNLTIRGFLFWLGVFCAALVGITYPQLTGKIAGILGIGRGSDAVIYISIALLFYLVFRTHMVIEDMRHEMSELIRKLALHDSKKRSK